jgi:asparagine synthase (glutamine-hydrolysing)
MCGIAGFASLEPHTYPDSILDRMTRAIAHRRLSIIDLAAGHQPMTSESGDLWITYNGEVFNQFRGMFSYAIWDRRTRKLFCARDRLGIKPFYYFWNGRELVFASEIKALLEHPIVSAQLEPSLPPEHLAFGYSSSELTLYRGIRKLMPGHTLTLGASGSLERHRRGQLDATDRLWRLLNPHVWGEMFIAGRRAPEEALLGAAAPV